MVPAEGGPKILKLQCSEGAEAKFWLSASNIGRGGGGGGGWHKASVFDCLPLAAPIGLSPLLILTLCGPERVLVDRGF